MNLTISYDQFEAHLIEEACDRTLVTLTHAWDEGRIPNIVLTGGRTGARMAKALDLLLLQAVSKRDAEPSNPVNFKLLNIWFSDERFVDLESADRSDTILIKEFSNTQNRINFQRFQDPSEISLAGAATEYGNKLQATLGSAQNPGLFDTVILSLGEDGHVASCFPGDVQTLASQNLTAAIANSPKPPKERITLTLAALVRTTQIIVFALGESKLNALSETIGRNSAMPLELLRQNSAVGQIAVLTDQKQFGGKIHV